MSDSNPDHSPSPAADAESAAGGMDAASQEIAAVYAKALLAAAEAAGKTARSWPRRTQIVGWLAGEPKFEQVLASELLGDDEKQGMIDRVFAARYDRTLVDFLRILSRRDRLGLLGPILREFGRQHNEVRGNVRVQVTTAAALPEAAAKQLAKALEPLVAGEPQLEITVDPALIGGAVLRIGDTVYDGSVAHQLQATRVSR